MFDLFIEAVVIGLMLYALIRGKWSWFEVLVPIFFIQLIAVIIALNVPFS